MCVPEILDKGTDAVDVVLSGDAPGSPSEVLLAIDRVTLQGTLVE